MQELPKKRVNNVVSAHNLLHLLLVKHVLFLGRAKAKTGGNLVGSALDRETRQC